MKQMSPEARSLVDAASGEDEPSPQDAARVKRALVAGIAAGGALGVSTSAAAATRTGALASQGAGAVTTVKVGAWLATGAAVGLATAGAWVGITGLGGKEAPPAPAPAAVTVKAPAAVTPPPEATPAAHVEVRNDVAPAENRDDSAEAVPPAPAKTPRQKAPAPIPQRAAVASSLAAETALLRSARAALGSGDARGALALLRQHAREYPNGALVEERLASEVFASCALGDRTNAARAAAELTRRAPSSPLRARVLDSCAGE